MLEPRRRSQVNLSPRQRAAGGRLVLPGGGQGDLLGGVAQHLLSAPRGAVRGGTKGLVGRGRGGHLLVEQVAVAVPHHVGGGCGGGGVSVGDGGHGQAVRAARVLHAAAAATTAAAHEGGKLWLLGGGARLGWPSLGRRAHGHPAGVRVAVLVAFPGAFARHGYVGQRPGVWGGGEQTERS